MFSLVNEGTRVLVSLRLSLVYNLARALLGFGDRIVCSGDLFPHLNDPYAKPEAHFIGGSREALAHFLLIHVLFEQIKLPLQLSVPLMYEKHVSKDNSPDDGICRK